MPVGSALLFSLDEFSSDETKDVARRLDQNNFVVTALVGPGATNDNLRPEVAMASAAAILENTKYSLIHRVPRTVTMNCISVSAVPRRCKLVPEWRGRVYDVESIGA